MRSSDCCAADLGDGHEKKVELEYGPGDVPASDTGRLAILIVNAVNGSPKLATFAQQRASTTAPPPKGDPFGKSTRDKPF